MRRRHSLALVALLSLALALAIWPSSAALATSVTPAEDPYEGALTLDWDDGAYLVDVSMEGGSGRASVSSPAEVTVQGGRAVARIEWSSPNYDYMLVADRSYLPVNDEGNSVFLIPLLALDEPFDVVGDTTAMSVPHEVAYRLTFDSASARPVDGGSQGIPWLWVGGGVAVVGCLAIALRGRRTSA